MRYFYHAESSSLWTEEDDSVDHEGDGLVIELTKEEYEERLKSLNKEPAGA